MTGKKIYARSAETARSGTGAPPLFSIMRSLAETAGRLA
jgi:hypothetical protein